MAENPVIEEKKHAACDECRKQLKAYSVDQKLTSNQAPGSSNAQVETRIVSVVRWKDYTVSTRPENEWEDHGSEGEKTKS